MNDTVLVTGASGGLGLELARLFAQHQYDLILTARSEQTLLEIQRDFEERYGVRITIIPQDLGKDGATDELMDAIRKQGLTVDILVNNAGFGDFGPFSECALEKQEAMVDLNITALMRLTHHILPQMKARGRGKILNVASIASFEPGPFMSVYYATKAFVLSFSQALARELKGSGITVTALCPGPIKTGFEKAAQLDNSRLFHTIPVATAPAVAKYGYKALMKGKAVAVHGLHCKLLVFAVRFAPRSLVTKIIVLIQGRRQKTSS